VGATCASPRPEPIGKRQGAGDEDVPIARLTEDVGDPAQLVIDSGALALADDGTEEIERRTQAAHRDAHLVDALGVAAVENRRLIGDEVVEAVARGHKEPLADADVGGQRWRAAVARFGHLSAQQPIADLGRRLDAEAERAVLREIEAAGEEMLIAAGTAAGLGRAQVKLPHCLRPPSRRHTCPSPRRPRSACPGGAPG